jgi:hypothetical protein
MLGVTLETFIMPNWETEHWTRVNTPDYRYRIANGVPLPENPFSHGGHTSTAYSEVRPHSGATPWGFPAISDGSSYNKAVRRYYNAADRLDFSAAVTIGEAPKTFELIADTAVRLFHLYKGIRKGSFEDIKSALGFGINRSYKSRLNKIGKPGRSVSMVKNQAANAADLFLEVKYGWTPLLNDIENALKVLETRWQEDPSDVKIVGSGSSSYFATLYNWDVLVAERTKLTSHFRILNQTTRNINSLGLVDLGGVVWELIPFSFVADWFIPIGDWIGAQTSLTGLEHQHGSQSSWFKNTARLNSTEWGNRFNMKLNSSPYIVWSYERGPLNNPPSTIPILKSKDFRSLFNFDKVLTSLSLLNSVFRGSKTRWSR